MTGCFNYRLWIKLNKGEDYFLWGYDINQKIVSTGQRSCEGKAKVS